MSTDIQGHEALHHHHQRLVVEWCPSEKTVLKIKPQWFGKIIKNIMTKVVLSDHPKIVLKIKQKWSGRIIENIMTKVVLSDHPKIVLKIKQKWSGKIIKNIMTKVVLSDHPKTVLKIKQKCLKNKAKVIWKDHHKHQTKVVLNDHLTIKQKWSEKRDGPFVLAFGSFTCKCEENGFRKKKKWS